MEVNDTTFVGQDIKPAATYIFIVIGSLEIIAGLFGNSLLLLVIFTQRSMGMRSFHYLFLANLALADLVTQGYWMTFFVLDLILHRHPVDGVAHCVANGFIISMSTAVTILSLTAISLNRYLHVVHNHLYSRIFTKTRIILFCLALWAVGAATAFPPLVGVGYYAYNTESHTCSYIRDDSNLYLKVTYMFFCTVPMGFVGYWNYAIFSYWKTSRLSLRNRYPLVPTTPSKEAKTGEESIEKMEEEKSDSCRLSAGVSSDMSASKRGRESSFMRDKTESNEPKVEEHARDSCMTELAFEGKDSALETIKLRRKKDRAREEAFVRSLYVVFLVMVASFTPYAIIIFVTWVVGALPPEVVIGSTLLLFFSSAVNWIVYGVMNRSFRRDYVKHVKRLLRSCWKRPCPRVLEDDLDMSLSSSMQRRSRGIGTELSAESHNRYSHA